MHSSRLNRVQKKQNTANIVLFSVLFIIVAFIIFLFTRAFQFYKNIKTKSTNKLVATKTPEQKNTYNILLLGYGGGKHEGTYLTDTIMVLSADTKTKKAVLISIPRDTYVELPTTGKEDYHAKINGAYQMGLFPNDYPGLDKKYIKSDDTGYIKYVINKITGIPIDAYVAIDFDGFTSAVDILGGLDINVDKTFTDYEYPIEGKEDDLCGKDEEFKQVEKFLKPGFDEEEKKKLFEEKKELEEFFKNITEDPALAFPCRYENLHFEKGEQHMDGVTALKYARSRHSLDDGGDFNRAKRQQKVLEAGKDKLLNIGVITKIVPLLNDLEKYIKTDAPQEDVQRLLPEFLNVNKYKIINKVIVEPDYLKSSYSEYGEYILIPKNGMDNWKEVQKDIRNIMLGITPTPTKVPITPKKTGV